MKNRQYFQMVFRDQHLWVGLALIVVSLGCYFASGIFDINAGDTFSLFWVNYVLLQMYFVYLWWGGNLKSGRRGRNTFAVYLTLCLISCFSLNRSIEIFYISADWWAIVLGLCCINNMLYAVKDAFPLKVRLLMAFMLGVSTCCFLYLTFCLLPGCVLGAVGALFFGIGLHVFIPLLFLIYTYILVSKYVWFRKKHRYAYLSGIGFVVIVLAVYTTIWVNAVSIINRSYSLPDNKDLPAWENVARKAPGNPVVERLLKAGLVYQTARSGGLGDMDGFLDMPRRSSFFHADQLHDPLVVIADLICRPYISEEDAAMVLCTMYDSRQETQKRLWNGDRLSTIQVRTNADLWPSLHLAYTEKVINVYSAAPDDNAWNNEEAIYTFHLPEGSVVTSLSLWINGREEKGILTTKEKADSAYQTVVGREARDPAVVHWQEGNTVKVRVFPVAGHSSRQFKIGITSPLLQQGKQLVYSNIWFEGPDATAAREDVQLNFQEAPVGVELPGMFSRKDNTFSSTGPYEAAWQVSCTDPGVRSNLFSFNGNSFFVAPYRKELGAATIKTIYLDVNQSWSIAEFRAIRQLHYPMMIFANNEWKPATEELFQRMQQDRYSLFPIYKVADRASALVITKGNVMSPGLEDLATSRFYEEVKRSMDTSGRLLLLNLGGELSPYLRTLKEYHLFRYATADVNELSQWMSSKQFPQDLDNDHRVVIAPAGITINMEENAGVSNAPDHLMRLFAYNHVMQKMGWQQIKDDDVLTTAKEAYIVTPASSLIVLETKQDYERFNIKDDLNSLKNASVKGKGAVPEPHEWALIVLGLVCIVWFKKKRAVAI
ncbi:XrtN system VIT domain-containing protein [Chitinophaga sp.]|uniref:XrtN system VIT domain-containing protein n=1 Tax=Chitinophaga sp. TaxID=1869181 RepID=UPI0031DA03C0